MSSLAPTTINYYWNSVIIVVALFPFLSFLPAVSNCLVIISSNSVPMLYSKVMKDGVLKEGTWKQASCSFICSEPPPVATVLK